MRVWIRFALLFVGFVAAALGTAVVVAGQDPPQVLPTVVDDPSRPSLLVHGVRLHAEIMGDPEAPVIVVLHGGPGDDFRALLPLAPLAEDHRVVFYDQRGAGLSERVPDAALGVDDYVRELHGVVEQVAGDRPVVLLGHSWGAMLAALYLAEHPDRVSSAILAEPGFLTEPASRAFLDAVQVQPTLGVLGHAAWTGLRSLHVRGPDAHARADWFMLTFVLEGPREGHPLGGYFCNDDPGTAHLPHFRFGSAASRAVRELAADGGIDFGIESGLRSYPGRVLLLAGSCNRLIGEPHQREHHLPLFADAELEVIEGAGHSMFGEQPAVSLARIRGFLKADEPGSSIEEPPAVAPGSDDSAAAAAR